MNILHHLNKRSFRLHGHATSIALEAPFWDTLDKIANAHNLALGSLIEKLDSHRQDHPLTSYLRLCALQWYKDKKQIQDLL
jgi:predicted DNA-binding ribbon-helix-helix protein